MVLTFVFIFYDDFISGFFCLTSIFHVRFLTRFSFFSFQKFLFFFYVLFLEIWFVLVLYIEFAFLQRFWFLVFKNEKSFFFKKKNPICACCFNSGWFVGCLMFVGFSLLYFTSCCRVNRQICTLYTHIDISSFPILWIVCLCILTHIWKFYSRFGSLCH